MFSSPASPAGRSPERPKSESELAVEQLERQEQEALAQWSEINGIVQDLGIELDAPLDPKESSLSYKGVKNHMQELKDEALKILFETDNGLQRFRKD